tara:strand:- start:1244 stop:1474 length:231 start_codon:yes stop_codon:yes gene_type:complete
MQHSITVKVTDWNGEKDLGLDEYVKAFTDQTKELYHVLDHKAETATDDWLHIKEIERWVELKAINKFTALYQSQQS